jgi:multiple antibiotic resistance protein
MALEMVLDVTIFKNEGLDGSGSIVPLAFPMYAGPGAFTALLSITAEYDIINLVISVTLNTIMLYAVLKGTNWLNKYLGQTSLYILRKFFGIIVLAIACKLMFGNLADVFVQSTKSTDKKIQQTEEIIQPVIETSSDSVLIK